MPSPFPGMDPYVEATGIWSSFHHAFLVGCAERLNSLLPEHYAAILDERLQLLGDDDVDLPPRVVEPDVQVVRPSGDPAPGGATGVRSASATLTPHSLTQTVRWLDLPKQIYAEVVHLPEQRVVTNIELLSPSNKRRGGEDRLAYLAKRRSLLLRRINLVEIDLLLTGERVPMLEQLPAGDYYAFVTRGQTYNKCDVYTWGVRQPLPAVPVPLEPPDDDVLLDLASVFTHIYDRGRYARLLRYGRPLELPLSEPDGAWATDVARATRS